MKRNMAERVLERKRTEEQELRELKKASLPARRLNLNPATRNLLAILSTRFLGQKHQDLRWRHAISPGFSGHYQDLGIPSLTRG